MSIARFIPAAACGGAAVLLLSCAAPAFYAPGALAAEKAGVILEPPDQTGVRGGYWRVEDGIELHHFSRGDGEPVLMLHGGPGVPFQSAWKGLEGMEGFSFIYYHERGCGSSTIPIDRFASGDYYRNMRDLDRALGMASQIADVERIRRILGVDKLTLVGHSYGGFIAALYAIEFPERVKKMVLVSPAALLSFPPADGGMDRMRDHLTEEGKARYDAFRKDYFDYGSIFKKNEKELAAVNRRYGDFYMEALRGSGVGIPDSNAIAFDAGGWVVHAVYMSLGTRYDYRPLAKGITAPVLVIHGGRDIPPESSSRAFAEAIPGARLAVIPEASHFAFEERPAHFREIVEGFLRE